MSKNLPTPNRRNVLKTLGGAAGLAAVGGGGLFALSGGASAEAVLDTSIEDTQISNDQGEIAWVGVQINKTIQWDGFDVPVYYIGFTHEVTVDNSTIDGSTDWHTLYDQMSGRLTEWSSQGSGSDGWGGPGEYIAAYTGDRNVDGLEGEAKADIQWAVISDGSHPSGWDSVQTPVDWTEQLDVPADGTSQDRLVRFRSTLTFYTEDSEGNAVQVDPSDGVPDVVGEDSFTVTVTNEQSETTGSTEDGSSTAG